MIGSKKIEFWGVVMIRIFILFFSRLCITYNFITLSWKSHKISRLLKCNLLGVSFWLVLILITSFNIILITLRIQFFTNNWLFKPFKSRIWLRNWLWHLNSRKFHIKFIALLLLYQIIAITFKRLILQPLQLIH